jgi:hypothetical protein
VDVGCGGARVTGSIPPIAVLTLIRGLLTVQPGQVSFRHELTRRAIVDALPVARRLELNARVLAVIEDLGVTDAGPGYGAGGGGRLVLAETLSSLPVDEALPAYQERRAPRIARVRAQAHRRDSTRGLTPAVRDKLLRLAGRRVALAGQRELLARP